MAEVGFVVDKSDSTLFIGTSQKSFNQRTADKTTKRDLVLNFRKPKAGEFVITRLVDGRTFVELGTQVIRDFLTSHPGATKDRIYDELVSRMVQAGKMEAHDFNALLRGVAEEVQEPVKENLFDYKEPDLFGSHISSRWYLKESADELDTAEQEKEDAAAARLEKHMAPTSASIRKTKASTTAISSSKSPPHPPTSPDGSSPTGSPNTSSRHPRHWRSRNEEEAEQLARCVRPALCGGSSGSPTP